MQQMISQLLRNYEEGKLTRRSLIGAIAALATGASTPLVFSSTFHGVAINHIAVRVSEIQRSRDFYQKHFGLPVLRESKTDCFLGIGKNFLTLFQRQTPGLDHFCLAIDNFQADRVVEDLKQQGLTPQRPSGSERVYFPDPDGLVVQVSSADHRP
ncbi:MAG TPA: VOC family protein [Acidobacteriota bacterium]|jgi:catechol 2,3-dioxygenase-like lactoylglutathione lyase family enzyme|nr:VOC family protein [Acidobacteriota bacterium]